MTIQQAFEIAFQHHQAGRLAEAEALYRQILGAEPRHADTLHLLGVIAHQVGRNDVAMDLIRQAVALNPSVPDYHSNLGEAYLALGQTDEAIAAYRKAIALKPDYAEAHSNLGNALRDNRRLDEAIAACRQAIALKPDYAEAHSNLGNALRDNDQLDEAIAAYRHAIAFNPNFTVAYYNLGNTLDEIGEPDAAIASYRQAIALSPDFAEAYSNLLLALNYHPGFDTEAIAEEHRGWSRRHAEPLRAAIQPHANDRDPARRLRIGYVSPDLRDHVIARFLLPLLEHHDRSAFEIFAYAQVPVPDAMTQRLRSHTDAWRSLVGLSDEKAAELIREDRIDILVDLAGHTANNRLLVFARKPAPIQVTWLGYPNTTGLETIDYRLTDAFADPQCLTDLHCAEQLIRLSPCAWCFQSEPTPAATPRRDGPITFGCFNTFAKVTTPILGLWARILLAVPDSRLLLKSAGLGSPTVRQRVQHLLNTLGIAQKRIELREIEPDYRDHLALYERIDIALDTFPYHGTTTTCEALWMGVPVISLAGHSHVSRVAVSLLSNIGLPELVATSQEHYIQLATALANDLPRLAQLRASLRQRMLSSPLMHAPHFARSVEAAFRQMWTHWCAANEQPANATGEQLSPIMTIPQAFELALQHHQAGRLPEAEALYRQILAADPHHSDSLHLLGVIAHQVGHHDAAVDLIRQAIALAPSVPDCHSNLGEACRAAGHLDDAIAAYRQAIALKPNYPEAHNNLAIALVDKGRLDDAIAACRQAIALKPDYPEAYSNLGNALRDKGQIAEAIASYRQAIALKPNFPVAHSNLGAALRDHGQLDDAAVACRQAIALKPDYPEAYSHLGSALRDNGQLHEAFAAFRKAIALKPDYADGHSNFGNALRDNGQLEEAITAFRKAIALKPDYAEAHSNLGNALRDKGQLDESIAACNQAINLKPNFPDAHNNLGNALHEKQQLDEAIAAYRQAIALKPDYPVAHSNLGNAFHDAGQLEDAIDYYRRAMELDPARCEIHSNLLLALNYHPGLDTESIVEEHRGWGRRHGEPLRALIQPHTNERSPGRRLRIGYVSPDLRDHVVARFLLPLLENHDRHAFEVFAYAQVPAPDAMTQRLRSHTDVWRSLVGLSDEKAACLIREDRIDILVDLAGHTANNRLMVFARKPAPVQVTWLGYPNTTGLETIDYRLTDAFADPPGQTDLHCAEQLIRLSPCAWCFQSEASPVATLRRDGPITFGCFNNFAKVTTPMLGLWARILLAAPDSRLLLKSASLGSPTVRQKIQRLLETLGIAPGRLELRGQEPDYRDHLALYERIDIALDTFPYHGTTTTCEALWMGVPVISLAGHTHVSRVGASLLSNFGLPELLASTGDEYIQLATALANDLPRLAQLRASLRQRMTASPLMDAPGFARTVEAAFRQMWSHWCANQQQPVKNSR